MKGRNEEKKLPHRPEGWPSVIPRIIAEHSEQLVEFLQHVFGAIGNYRSNMPSVLKIGDSVIMVSEAGVRKSMPSFLYVYVANADETFRLAIQAGAKSMEEPTETPYGDRRGMVQDKWGNVWQIATYKGR